MEGGRGLLCTECKYVYPVREGVPVLVMEEATNPKENAQTIGETLSKRAVCTFRIIEGPNKNLIVRLEESTCKAIGRASGDPNKTAMFHVEVGLALDESTKELVKKYISRQFRKTTDKKNSELGDFRRTADIVLDDISASRLHAMVFYDSAGVGILDLVSKNGTFVNGKEVESRLLQKGDVIEIGETKIQFEG